MRTIEELEKAMEDGEFLTIDETYAVAKKQGKSVFAWDGIASKEARHDM